MAISSPLNPLTQRLLRLDRERRRQASRVTSYTWDQMRMSCACPPDTTVRIRAGFAQQGSYWAQQETIWFPELVVDFADPTQFVTYDGNFTNAGYYWPLLLRYSDDYFYALRDGGSAAPIVDYGATEYATAGEAEVAAQGWFDGATVLYDGYLPLCVVVLKNNGTTGSDGQVLPVDQVNRGRSYFWRDVRPRNVCPFFDW